MRKEDNRIVYCTQQPQNSIDKINPNSMFHTYNPTITLGIFTNKHLPKYTEEGYPENAVNAVSQPNPQSSKSRVLYLQHYPIPRKQSIHSKERHSHNQ